MANVKNKQIADQFLENNKHKQDTKELWPGVLKAVQAIEGCPVELVVGAAQSMHNIGVAYGLQVVLFCIHS